MKALIRGALHASDIEMSGLLIEKQKISDQINHLYLISQIKLYNRMVTTVIHTGHSDLNLLLFM